jgi:hypothetical protein
VRFRRQGRIIVATVAAHGLLEEVVVAKKKTLHRRGVDDQR